MTEASAGPDSDRYNMIITQPPKRSMRRMTRDIWLRRPKWLSVTGLAYFCRVAEFNFSRGLACRVQSHNFATVNRLKNFSTIHKFPREAESQRKHTRGKLFLDQACRKNALILKASTRAVTD